MATRESIITVTSNLFLERGCKSVTMDEVAQNNGISKRTLYEIFPDKAALLEACILYQRGINKKLISAIYEKSATVLDFFLISHEIKSETLNKHERLFSEVKRFYPEIFRKVIMSIHDENIRILGDLLELGKRQGVFMKECDVRITSNALNEIVNIVNSMGPADTVEYSKTELMRGIVLVYLRGVCTIEGIRIMDKFMESNRQGKRLYDDVIKTINID